VVDFISTVFKRKQNTLFLGTNLANGAHIWGMMLKFGKILYSHLAKFSTVFWQNSAVSKRQNVGETEWRIFRQAMCTGDFLLGAQSLVKLTPGKQLRNSNLGNFSTITE
jgi:hypothetical protein